MSSLRKDSKQHRSITAPFWQNQTQACTSKTTKLLQILYVKKQQLQSESDFCDVALVCYDGDIGTHKCMISSSFG